MNSIKSAISKRISGNCTKRKNSQTGFRKEKTMTSILISAQLLRKLKISNRPSKRKSMKLSATKKKTRLPENSKSGTNTKIKVSSRTGKEILKYSIRRGIWMILMIFRIWILLNLTLTSKKRPRRVVRASKTRLCWKLTNNFPKNTTLLPKGRRANLKVQVSHVTGLITWKRI